MFISGSGGPWRGGGGNASDTPVGQGTPLVISASPDIFNIGISGWSKEQQEKNENSKKRCGNMADWKTMTRTASRRRMDCLGNHTGY